MLPEVAQGDSNKLWIVPSEMGKALEGIGGFFGKAGGEQAQPRQPDQTEPPGPDGSGSVTRLPRG